MTICKLNILLLSLSVIIFTSCGPDLGKQRIRVLQKQFKEVNDPVRKSEIANILHREYALSYLHHPDDTAFLLEWAAMALQGGEYEQAREILSHYLTLEMGNAQVWESRGAVNATLGYLGQAGKDYLHAALISEDRGTMDRLERVAKKYMVADSVIVHAEQQIEAGETVNRYRLDRADQFMNTGLFAEARYDIEAVLEGSPEEPYAWLLFAKLCDMTGELQAAREALYKLDDVIDETDTYYTLQASELRERVEKELQLIGIQQTIKTGPKSYELLVNAGTICFDLKDYQSAGYYFSGLVEAFPDSLLGYLYRGQVHIQTGKLDEALADMVKATGMRPDNIAAHNLKGYVHLLRKEYEQVRLETATIQSLNGKPLDILLKAENDL